MKSDVEGKIGKIIDDYFSMFGYGRNEVKVGNINVRGEWSYRKREECNLVSINCRKNDIRGIKKIFENGIRFWKNGSEIGKY